MKQRPFAYEVDEIVWCKMQAGIMDTDRVKIVDRKISRLTRRPLYRCHGAGIVGWRPESAIVERVGAW